MFTRIQRYFISGLVVLLPLTLTVYLLIFIINFADGVLGTYLRPLFADKFGFYFQGLSILVGFSVIVLIGFLATNFFGRKLHEWFEKVIVKLPFFKQIYPAIKEIAVFLFSRDKLAFKNVVIVEYPRKGLYSFGFLTNESNQRLCKLTNQDLCNVFIPSAPGPITGYVIMVPRKDLIMTDIPIDEAVKFIVSGGVVNPLII